MGLRLEGIDQLKRELDRRNRAVNQVLPPALASSAEDLADEVRSRAPQESGTLRDSIETEPVQSARSHYEVEVTVPGGHPDDPYLAMQQEYGTSRQPADPFVRPAFHAQKAHITDKVLGAAKDAAMGG